MRPIETDFDPSKRKRQICKLAGLAGGEGELIKCSIIALSRSFISSAPSRARARFCRQLIWTDIKSGHRRLAADKKYGDNIRFKAHFSSIYLLSCMRSYSGNYLLLFRSPVQSRFVIEVGKTAASGNHAVNTFAAAAVVSQAFRSLPAAAVAAAAAITRQMQRRRRRHRPWMVVATPPVRL